MESIRTASAAVKYSVVKKSKAVGFFRAMAVKRTVQRGKRFVMIEVTFFVGFKECGGGIGVGCCGRHF